MAQLLPSSHHSHATNTNVHQAFPIYDDKIRVVDLLPGTGLDAITLECRIISLSDDCSFEALSYVWGDLLSKCTVEISGYNVEITQMLYAGFQRLRHSQNKRTLWVDQVCINQGDDIEKSHQVSLMRTIYRKCSQCVIWLGELPSDGLFSRLDAEAALDFIHAVAYDRPYPFVHAGRKTHTFITDDDNGKRARRAFEALIMGGNPWWSRVWTLQEASLPFEATLQWGSLTVPLETVELAAKTMCLGWYCDIPSDKVKSEYEHLVGNFLYPVRGLSIARAGEAPLNTLMRWRYRNATDPRDKVYGFVGLFRSDSLHSVPALRDISYRISPAVLFARVTLDLIRLDKDLRPLVGARELPHVTPALPTWAIDFASCSAIGQRQTKWWQHSHRYHRWTASKGLTFQVEASTDEKTLRLSGVLVDHVHRVGEVYNVSVEDEIDDQSLRETVMQSTCILEEYLASRGSDLCADYIGGGTLQGAFWRTMLGNLIMGEMPQGVPHDEYMSDFEDYVNYGRHSRLTRSLHGLVPNHAFFITATGYIGIGPSDLREGDQVCVFGGGRVPFVIRPEEAPFGGVPNAEVRRYHLVGDVYMHGVMRGEAVNQHKGQAETIDLI